MSADPRTVVSWEGLLELLLGAGDPPGVFISMMGVSPQTTSLKGVHVMNDVAQCVVGGAPAGGGDLLCHVIRHDQRSPSEDNSDSTLRFNERHADSYSRAFPRELGAAATLRLRRAAELLLNNDGGMYKPRTRMASGLGTHMQLLGFEGFRRFGVGQLIVAILGEEGRQVLRELFWDARDPVARALRPLFQDPDLVDTHPDVPPIPLSDFDGALGLRLTALLRQPLSKPVLLRLFVQAATLGLFLKVNGAGAAGGRPLLLALGPGKLPMALRQSSAATLRRGIDMLDREIADGLNQHPGLAGLISGKLVKGDPAIEVESAMVDDDAGIELVRAARSYRAPKGVTTLTWPEEWVYSLGRRSGFLPPGGGRAQYLRLSSELVEALVLMYVPDGKTAAWTTLWEDIWSELGLVVGADTFRDRRALEGAGALMVSAEDLSQNSEGILQAAIQRGVARQLPDSGAEAGGICGDLP